MVHSIIMSNPNSDPMLFKLLGVTSIGKYPIAVVNPAFHVQPERRGTWMNDDQVRKALKVKKLPVFEPIPPVSGKIRVRLV